MAELQLLDCVAQLGFVEGHDAADPTVGVELVEVVTGHEEAAVGRDRPTDEGEPLPPNRDAVDPEVTEGRGDSRQVLHSDVATDEIRSRDARPAVDLDDVGGEQVVSGDEADVVAGPGEQPHVTVEDPEALVVEHRRARVEGRELLEPGAGARLVGHVEQFQPDDHGLRPYAMTIR